VEVPSGRHTKLRLANLGSDIREFHDLQTHRRRVSPVAYTEFLEWHRKEEREDDRELVGKCHIRDCGFK